jgi:hypothetical protein
MVTNYKGNVHDARRKNERAVLQLGISGISGIYSAYLDDRPDLVGVVVSALPHLSLCRSSKLKRKEILSAFGGYWEG